MDKQFQSGQQVTANAYGGKKLSRTVVEDRGEVVLICQQEEFQRARAEGRTPVAVGFPKKEIEKS